MLQLPDAPFLPDHLRGRSFVLVEVAFIGTASDGAALVQPLRDFGPEFDTIAMMPTSELSVVNMDPDTPLPYTGDGILLTDLPPAAIDAMVEAFVGSPLLHVEARHLGGAASIRSPDHGVLNSIDQSFVVFTFGLAPDPDAYAAVDHHAELVLTSAWAVGQRPEVPELRGVTRRFAVDLPGRDLRPVQARQGAIRPDRLVPREPRDLRRGATSPVGRRCRRPIRAGPCCA